MTYFNNLGQGRVGWRSPSGAVTPSTLWNSIYSVWNADTLGTSLDTSIFRAYNGEAATVTPTQLSTNIFGVWNADGTNNLSVKHAWNANGDAVDSKSGANGTVATPSGTSWTPTTMTYGSGKLGSGAFTFNGSNFVSLPADTLNFTGDFSVSAWIYVPTAFGTNISRIISCFDNQTGPTTYRGWEVVYNNGTVKLQIYPNGATYYIISVPMTLKDQWVHVTAVRIAGQQGEIYINGVAGTKTVSANGATSASAIAYGTGNLAYIGALYDSGLSPRYSVTPAGGFKIDALQTFNNAALDQAAVTELYNSGNGQEYPFTLSSSLIATYNDAVGSNHGTTPASTLTGGVPGPSFTTGKIGKAFTFDGINDYVALPNNSLNSLTTDFSVSGWIYMPANTSNSYCVLLSNVSNDYTTGKGWSVFTYGNNIYFDVYYSGVYQSPNSAYVRLQVNNVLTNNAWNHVTITRKNSTSSKIYINGSLVGSNTSSQNPATPTAAITPTIGVLSSVGVGNPLSSYAPNGTKMDAVSVWNRELTAEEITALYNSGNGQQYPFSSVTLSNSILDSVNAQNGTNINNVTFTTGKVGNAFTFNGSNYVALPNSSFDFLGDFSISAWVKIPSAPTSIAYIFQNDNYDVATSYGYGLNVRTNRTVSFYVGSINGTSTVTSTTVLALNTWYHVTVKRDSVAKRSDLYINGVFEAQATNTNITIGYGTRAIQPTIGAYRGNNQGVLSTSNFLNGSVDALTIWDKKLSDNEITSLYNSGNGAEYPFSTQTLDSLNDAVGSNHGTRPASTLTGGVPGPSFTTGKIGKAFTFDGINDYIALPNNTMKFNSDFSISLWSNLAGTFSNVQALFSNITYDGTYTYGYYLYYYNSTLTFQISNNSGSVQLQSTLTNLFNSWKNIVITRKYSTGTKMYIDGVLVASNTSTQNPNYHATMTPSIGAANYGPVDSNQVYYYTRNSGKIDAVNVWNRELSATEVTELYNSGNGKQYPN